MKQRMPSYAPAIKKARRLTKFYAGIKDNPDMDALVILINKLDNPKVRGIARHMVKESIDTIVKRLESFRVVKKNIKLLADKKDRVKSDAIPAWLVERDTRAVKEFNALVSTFFIERKNALYARHVESYSAFHASFSCPAMFLYQISKSTCPASWIMGISRMEALDASYFAPEVNRANIIPDKVNDIKCRECEGHVIYRLETRSNRGYFVCDTCGLVHEGDLVVTRSEDLRQFDKFMARFNQRLNRAIKEYNDLMKYPGRRFKRGEKLQEAIDREIKQELEAYKNAVTSKEKKEHLENVRDYEEANELIKSGILNASLYHWNALSMRQLMLLLETIYQYYKIASFFNGDAFTGSLFTKKERNLVRKAYLDIKFKRGMNWIYNPPESSDEFDRNAELNKLLVKARDAPDKYAHLKDWSDDQIKYEIMNEGVDHRTDKDIFDMLS